MVGHLVLDMQGRFAAGQHTDYGMVTILATDEVPGLQACHYSELLRGEDCTSPDVHERSLTGLDDQASA